MFKSEWLQPLTQVSCDYCVDAAMDMQHPYTLDPCSTSVCEFQFTSSHNSLVRKSIAGLFIWRLMHTQIDCHVTVMSVHRNLWFLTKVDLETSSCCSSQSFPFNSCKHIPYILHPVQLHSSVKFMYKPLQWLMAPSPCTKLLRPLPWW